MLQMKFVRFVTSVLILFLAFLFSGCFTEEVKTSECTTECTIIKGKFITEDGSVPVGGADLRLSWFIPASIGFGFGGDFRLIGTTKTSANGEYFFKFHLNDKELTDGEISISYKAAPEKYYMLSGYNFISFGRISKRDTIISYDYYLPTIADLKIKIVNPEVIVGDKLLTVFVIYCAKNGMDIGHMLSAGEGYHNMKTDTVLQVAANQINHIRIQKKLGYNSYSNTIDSIFVNKNQTNVYKITF